LKSQLLQSKKTWIVIPGSKIIDQAWPQHVRRKQ